MLIFVSLPFAIIGTFFVGFLYDILGRRVTLFVSFVLGSVLIAFVPQTSPSVIPWLLLIRIAIQLTLCAPNAQPLPADYIHSSAVGQGVAMIGLGVIIGEVLSIGVLFRLTANMQPERAFQLCGAVGILLSFCTLFMINEPQTRAKTSISIQNALLQPTTPMAYKKVNFEEA